MNDRHVDAPVEFLTVLFRLMKLAGMHDLTNAASSKAIDRGVEKISELMRAEYDFFSVLFADETVFVNGSPLRAERSVYESALEIGKIISKLGCNEFLVRRGVTRDEITEMLRTTSRGERLDADSRRISEHIEFRDIDPSHLLRDEDELSIEEQVVSAYSAACVIAAKYEEEFWRGEFRLLRYLKRLAQRFATLSDGGTPYFLALATSRVPQEAGRARVHAAVTATLAGRLVTRDFHALMRMAYVALVKDLGAPRVAGAYREGGFGGAVVTQLNSTMRKRLPHSSALLMLEAGRSSEPALARLATLFEVQWIEEANQLGSLYDRELPPMAESAIALAASRFVGAMQPIARPDHVVTKVRQVTVGRVNQAANYLVFSAVGLRPAGTPVELADGSRGVVLSAGASFDELAYNPVVTLQQPNGQLTEPFIHIAGNNGPAVRRCLHETDDAFNSAFTEFKVSDTYEKWNKRAGPPDMLENPSPLAGETFGTLEETLEK